MVYLCYAVLSVHCSIGLTSSFSCVLCFLVCVFHFIIRCSGSGMVLDCIDSGCLPSSLLCMLEKSMKEGKDQESIQSRTTPDLGYQWESLSGIAFVGMRMVASF